MANAINSSATIEFSQNTSVHKKVKEIAEQFMTSADFAKIIWPDTLVSDKPNYWFKATT